MPVLPSYTVKQIPRMCILVSFQHRPMLIATSMESSRRDLLNYVAEQRPI